MGRFLLILTAGAVLVSGGAARATSASSPPPVADGRLAFAMAFGDRLVTMNPDGTGAAVISYAFDAAPAWSSDGSLLAVSSGAAGNGDIVVMSAVGENRRQVTSSADPESDPSWAPCDCLLAYERSHDGDTAVYEIAADGTGEHELSDGPGCDEDPAFSPDGYRIAFTSCRSGSRQIYLMDGDGSDVTRLTHDSGEDADPAWSPDGQRIAFDSVRDGERRIYSIRINGTEEVGLTAGPDDRAPAWAPDGLALAYDDRDTVEVMSLNGPYLTPVANAGGPPAWQPLHPTEGDCTGWGSAGNDIVSGGPGSDVLCAEAGDDRLDGGPDADVLRGGDGNDVLDARDGTPDVVDGGPGYDVALVDRGDRTLGVEDVRYVEPRNLARGRPVTASFWLADSPPSFVVDGKRTLWWGSDYGPQWIEIDLGRPSTIRRLELVVAQTPAGDTLHIVRGRDAEGRLHLLKVFARWTGDGDVLRFKPKRPWRGIVSVRLDTLESPSWVAWKEIRVLR